MAQQEKIMAEGSGPGPEAVSAGTQSGRESAAPVNKTSISSTQALNPRARADVLEAIKHVQQVNANASLSDKERIQTAKELLETKLSSEQEKAILMAHQVGAKETGADQGPAGVYNYTQAQLRQKAEILKEAGFSKEQRRSLVESGLTGTVPEAEFATFTTGVIRDPKLKPVADKLKALGLAGKVDEKVLNRLLGLLAQWNNDFETDVAENQDLQDKVQEWLRIADDPILPYADRQRLEQLASREGASAFVMARLEYDFYMDHSPYSDNPNLQQQLEVRQQQSRARLEQLEQFAEHHPAHPLKEFIKDLVESYKRIKETRPRELQGGGRKDMIERERASRAGTQENRLNDYADLAPLKSVIGGMFAYIWDGVGAEISKEEGQIDRESKNPLAKRIFERVKRLRLRDRMSTKEKRYSQAESWYGGQIITMFSWPEGARDMILTTLDWVKDRLAAIGERDPNTMGKLLEEIRTNGPMLLENSRIRINTEPVLVAQEGGEIMESNPEYKRARAFAESMPDVIANEKIMKKGNTEFGPQAKDRFAAHFIENFDAAYLENPKAALEMYLLRTLKDGTFWAGHPWEEEKVEEGPIIEYREAIQEAILEYASTHDFFTETVFLANQDLFTKDPNKPDNDPVNKAALIRSGEDAEDVRLGYTGFFELREKNKLQYSAHDPLEVLLLDPGDVIRQRIEAIGDRDALRRHDLRVGVFRSTKAMLDEQEGWGFVPAQVRREWERRKKRPMPVEELMILSEKYKNERRVQYRQHLIRQGHDPNRYAKWIEDQLTGEAEEKRQVGLRDRIRREMERKSTQSNSDFAKKSVKDLADLNAAIARNDLEAVDKITWGWVKDYNEYRIREQYLRKWYPSGWDRVRIKIDRAAKVIDRSLTDEEFGAMYEEINLPEIVGEDEKAVEARERINEIKETHRQHSRFGFEIARSFQVFMMEDTLLGGMRTRLRAPEGYKLNGRDVSGEYIGRLPSDEDSLLLGLIKPRINPATGQPERDSEGKIIYDTVNPNRKTIRVWDIVVARLQDAIAKEAAQIEAAKVAKRAAEESGNQAEIKRTSETLREMLANAQFVATHALKAKGLVSGKLPVWSYNFLDNATIKAFGEAMADYGVEVAHGIPFADYKKEIYEYLERGRRGLYAEKNRAAMEYMEGRYPIYERENGEIVYMPLLIDGKPVYGENGRIQLVPKPAVSLMRAADDRGEPGPMNDRFRQVNKGAVNEDTMITEAEFNISSSGGVKVPELIASMGQLGFDPLSVWLAANSILELNNYIKRRNEAEYHFHRFFDSKDAPQNAKAQAAAYLARKALTGGSLGEGQSTPGFLNEPFDGAYKIADMLFSWCDIIAGTTMADRYGPLKHVKTYVDLRRKVRLGVDLSNQEKALLEKSRQMTYLDWDRMDKEKMQDPMYKEVYGILKNFVTYLKAEKEVEQNRIGNAPRNYVYENTKKWYAFRRAIRESVAKGDKGFFQRLGYAGEISSEVSIRAMEVGLHDADYLILRDYERERLAMEGSEILCRALTDQERRAGFVIPAENKWKDQRSGIREALETIRRRGLLEFMLEEGYKMYDIDDKGRIKRSDDRVTPNAANKIPDERDWQRQPEPIRKALQEIKDQGLLEFMQDEGYEVYLNEDRREARFKRTDQGSKIVYFKEILGNKIPPIVQQAMVNGDRDYNLQVDPKLMYAA